MLMVKYTARVMTCEWHIWMVFKIFYEHVIYIYIYIILVYVCLRERERESFIKCMQWAETTWPRVGVRNFANSLIYERIYIYILKPCVYDLSSYTTLLTTLTREK